MYVDTKISAVANGFYVVLSTAVRTGSMLLLPLLLAGCLSQWTKTTADADGDQVVDTLDRCADTPARHPVDKTGCELFTGSLPDVRFAPGSAALNTKARASLDNLVAQLSEYPSVELSIEGHTDNRGSAAENLNLSKKRVMAVVRYLVVKGVNGRRLRPYGFGESRPLFSNATEEGRQKNRRITMSIFRVAPAEQ